MRRRSPPSSGARCARRPSSSTSSVRRSCAIASGRWSPDSPPRRRRSAHGMPAVRPRAVECAGGAPPRAPAVGRVACAGGERRRDERLATVPPKPGVYLLKDRAGKVIYVGKAKSLRSRVASYFRGGDGRSQVAFLVQRVGDVECLVTQNEKEALILENNLIKQYKPRYNVRLKDDKSYVSVKITN